MCILTVRLENRLETAQKVLVSRGPPAHSRRAHRPVHSRSAAYWFANKPGAADKELRELEAFCFLSGSYGGYLSQRICLMRKKQKNESGIGWKLQYFWHRLFPPFAILCMRYPKLKTPPWLLPYFWLCRLFDFSYWKNNFHREMATLQQVEQEKT